MEFKKDARKTGLTNLIIGGVIIAALVSIHVFLLNKPDVPLLLSIGLWLVGGLVGLIFCWQGVSLLKSGGEWKITVDENGISWDSPNQSVDKSFNFTLAEIDRVETRISRTKGKGSSTSRRHYIITRTGLE